MGNFIAYHSSSNSAGIGRVILSDGRVFEFDTPLTAAELMLEYPQQVVVEFRSDLTGKRPAPLPADNKLDLKKVYLMLPKKRGKPASLSSEEARHVLLSANSVLRSRSLLSSSRYFPLFSRICPAGNGEVITQKKELHVEEKPFMEKYDSDELTEIFESRPEYLSRQLSGKGTWKPSLDTIKEKKIEKKIPHWLF
uniref:Uncharacterized protein n=1 Tax=Salix viminalis TaxID=40686 RepID=A0A6N2MYT3_SALVM